MTPNIIPSKATDKVAYYHDLKDQVKAIVDGQRNWVNTPSLYSMVVVFIEIYIH
jgi:hypothetical protein